MATCLDCSLCRDVSCLPLEDTCVNLTGTNVRKLEEVPYWLLFWCCDKTPRPKQPTEKRVRLAYRSRGFESIVAGRCDKQAWQQEEELERSHLNREHEAEET